MRNKPQTNVSIDHSVKLTTSTTRKPEGFILDKMDEEEALRNYCRAMIFRVQHNEQRLKSSEENGGRQRHRGASRRDSINTETRAGTGFRDDREGDLPLCHQTEPTPCQRPQVQQPVPLQLIAMLRMKRLKEQLRRAAEVELHDPALCGACEEERASLTLKTFIRRKKTQLQFQILTSRQNTAESGHFLGVVGVKYPKALRCPSLDLGGTTWCRYTGHSNLGLP